LSLTQNLFSELDADFDQAKQTLNILKSEPGNDVKLRIYALFKQATKGENTESPPSAINFVAKVKYNAWKALSGMTQDEAKQKYVDIVEGLRKAED